MGKQRPLTAADYERLAEFRHVLRTFLAFSEGAAVAAGLTPQQHQALLAIKGFANDRVRMADLAERLGIKHHSAVGLVDRLEGNGLVARHIDPNDLRQVMLATTAKADKLLASLSMAHRDELERIAPLLQTLLEHFGNPPGPDA
jgi:DNA-binding MarR family transcriptional regulator